MKISIWSKLLVGIILIIMLITVLSVVSILSISKLGKLSDEVFTEAMATHLMQDIKVNFERLLMPANDYLIHGNKVEHENFHRLIGVLRSELQEYSELAPPEVMPSDLEELQMHLGKIEQISGNIFNLAEPIGNPLGSQLMEEMDLITELVRAKIDRIIAISEGHIQDDITLAQKMYITDTKAVIVVGIMILFALLIGGFFYVREITKPIKHLKLTAQRISSGQMNVKAEVKTRDEIEDLAASFNRMINVLEKTTVNRKYFNNILNRMEESLIITDENDKIKIVNQKTLEMLDYREEELMGKSIHEIISRKRCGKDSLFDRDVKDILDSGNVSNVYNIYCSKEAKPIPVLFSRSIMYDDQKNVLGMIHIARHISDDNGEDHLLFGEDSHDFTTLKTVGDIPLTKRELEIIKLIAQEYSNTEIAEKLFISVRTVETHRRNIMQKLQVNSVISLVHYAIQNRII